MCNCSKKDQTPDEVIKFVKEMKIDVFSEKVSGIGMFFIPAPEIGIMETRTILVDDISYKECAKRGENCLGFKWIPKGFKTSHNNKEITLLSSDDIRNQLWSCDDCRGGCVMGCHCISGWTWCQPNRY
jgi:hypothetical protein